ncbi:MFS transporter [Flavobacteriales bacterium]|nr:MFS transporter [Flavobacteriales bacterium]
MHIKHNIIKMYFLKGVLWFMLSMPIIILFFKENGLSLTEIMTLQGAYSLTVALFEVPSGYLADLFGRKACIVFSTIFSFVGFLFFCFFSGFYYFLIAQILVGFAGSLISGSDSALIYDTLLQTNNKDDYAKIEGRNYAIGNFSEATAGIFGGFLAVSSIYLPVYVQTAFIFLSIPIAFTLVEPEIKNITSSKNSLQSIFILVKSTLFESSKLRWLIVYSSAMGVATLSMAWFSQPFFIAIDLPLVLFGIFWALLNFSSGISSYNSHYFSNKFNYKSLIYFSVIMSLSFFLLGFSIISYGLFFIFIIYFLRGIVTPILRNEINKITSSNIRATVLSVRSFIIRVSFAILAPVLGFIAEHNSLSITFYFLAVVVGFSTLLSAFKLNKLE